MEKKMDWDQCKKGKKKWTGINVALYVRGQLRLQKKMSCRGGTSLNKETEARSQRDEKQVQEGARTLMEN